MKNQLSTLLEQEMDRKEFLRYFGVGMLFLLGGGAIFQALSQGVSPQKQNQSHGYGSTPYGR